MKTSSQRRLLSKSTSGLFALALGFSASAQASVWTTTNSWSKEWENRYSEWVKTNWDEKFFAKPGTPFTGLKLDCADTLYSMRIIYSYYNGLPFAMKDPTGGKKLITNEMTRFDNLPKDKRVRAFLQFVYGVGSTQSLPADTYSPRISRETVKSGSLIRTDQRSHHSWTIKEVLPTGIPHLIFSSRPAKNVLQVRIGQPSMEFTFKGTLDPSRQAGFRNFRNIEDLLKPEWEVAGYSDEQYHFPYKQWQSIVKKKLALVEETGEALLKRELDLACTSARERVESVNEGLTFLAKNASSRCLNETEFDDYSTPNRDLRLKNAFEELRDSYREIEQSPAELSKLPHELVLQVQDVLSDTPTPGQSGYCPVDIAPGRTLRLGEIRKRSLEGTLSSNPHDPFEYRWGDRAGNSARAKKCPSFE